MPYANRPRTSSTGILVHVIRQSGHEDLFIPDANFFGGKSNANLQPSKKNKATGTTGDDKLLKDKNFDSPSVANK